MLSILKLSCGIEISRIDYTAIWGHILSYCHLFLSRLFLLTFNPDQVLRQMLFGLIFEDDEAHEGNWKKLIKTFREALHMISVCKQPSYICMHIQRERGVWWELPTQRYMVITWFVLCAYCKINDTWRKPDPPTEWVPCTGLQSSPSLSAFGAQHWLELLSCCCIVGKNPDFSSLGFTLFIYLFFSIFMSFPTPWVFSAGRTVYTLCLC